jgi:hypothetical protein
MPMKKGMIYFIANEKLHTIIMIMGKEVWPTILEKLWFFISEIIMKILGLFKERGRVQVRVNYPFSRCLHHLVYCQPTRQYRYEMTCPWMSNHDMFVYPSHTFYHSQNSLHTSLHTFHTRVLVPIGNFSYFQQT